jgi:hypothetical protein
MGFNTNKLTNNSRLTNLILLVFTWMINCVDVLNRIFVNIKTKKKSKCSGLWHLSPVYQQQRYTYFHDLNPINIIW